MILSGSNEQILLALEKKHTVFDFKKRDKKGGILLSKSIYKSKYFLYNLYCCYVVSYSANLMK